MKNFFLIICGNKRQEDKAKYNYQIAFFLASSHFKQLTQGKFKHVLNMFVVNSSKFHGNTPGVASELTRFSPNFALFAGLRASCL